MNGLRNSMENHFAEMVVWIEGFTQELKSALVLQQTNVQQALGLVAGADQAAERVANLEKQLQKSGTSHCLRQGKWNGWKNLWLNYT